MDLQVHGFIIYGFSGEEGIDVILSQHRLTIRDIMNAHYEFEVIESLLGATRDQQMKLLTEWGSVLAMVERDSVNGVELWTMLK